MYCRQSEAPSNGMGRLRFLTLIRRLTNLHLQVTCRHDCIAVLSFECNERLSKGPGISEWWCR
jgi:hypothetical protein